MDDHITYQQQLQNNDGPVILINQFNLAPQDTARFLEAWTHDAAYMKQQPGFISTQLHQGTAGSTTFINLAVWESARALGRAFSSPQFQARVARYPNSTVATPHLFTKVTVPGICVAYAAIVANAVRLIGELNRQVEDLGEVVGEHFRRHQDAEVYLSQPGLGPILAARILGEFGDDPHRFADAKARKNYTGTSPITKTSGTRRAVIARYARNKRLGDAVQQWAFCSLRGSPGATAYYQALRGRNIGHQAALRQLANRLVGVLHGCLKTGTIYDDTPPGATTHAAA
jgi:heme-degrading monooxygenase HmoA